MRTLKMLAPGGFNIEDWPNTIYTTYYIKVFQLFSRQYIRTWMELGLSVIIFMLILDLRMYLLFYIVYVTSYSFTAVFGTIQASRMECFCENSQQPLAINCFCRKLHFRCLHRFWMPFWLFCFNRNQYFVNAVVEG